jgi:6-phosphogluconolactonase
MKQLFILILAALVILPAMAEQAPDSWRVYIGTYTGGKSEGVYMLRLDTETGQLENLGLAGAVDNPSFLALHPEKPLLYSVGQGLDADGKQRGMASALAMNPADGKLSLINQEVTVGEGPCHVAVDSAGRHILAANYSSGSVAVLPITEDGSLGAATDFEQHEGFSVNPKRQEGPHAHCVKLDPAGKFAFVIDLGLDRIMIYRYDDAEGTLEPNDPPFATVAPGAGPRHFAFHPSGNFAYVVNELGNTVTAFAYDGSAGTLNALQTIGTLPDGFDKENTTAEICVHPSGKFVYASNRGHDSIACFAVDVATGKLTMLGQVPSGGSTPRNFNVSPDGKFLIAANQQSNNVVAFRINLETGLPKRTGSEMEIAAPVCVVFSRP